MAPRSPTSVYRRGEYGLLASEEVYTERMTLAELLRMPPPSSFAEAKLGVRMSEAPMYAATPVDMRGGGGEKLYSAFPAPMRGDERPSVWKAPESWGVGGSEGVEESEKGGEVEGRSKKRWYKELFKYREGYTGGVF
jgi:hypothetical protein